MNNSDMRLSALSAPHRLNFVFCTRPIWHFNRQIVFMVRLK